MAPSGVSCAGVCTFETAPPCGWKSGQLLWCVILGSRLIALVCGLLIVNWFPCLGLVSMELTSVLAAEFECYFGSYSSEELTIRSKCLRFKSEGFNISSDVTFQLLEVICTDLTCKKFRLNKNTQSRIRNGNQKRSFLCVSSNVYTKALFPSE